MEHCYSLRCPLYYIKVPTYVPTYIIFQWHFSTISEELNCSATNICRPYYKDQFSLHTRPHFEAFSEHVILSPILQPSPFSRPRRPAESGHLAAILYSSNYAPVLCSFKNILFSGLRFKILCLNFEIKL